MLQYANSNTNLDTSLTADYNTLAQYIKLYQCYKNKDQSFKVELIFIKSNIQNLLINTFDYDIVKNYWKNGKIYCLNHFAILNKSATMSYKHFVKRIISGSKIEFTNFINRYNKYVLRGFKMFIHKTNITKHIFNHIYMMYVSNQKINNNLIRGDTTPIHGNTSYYGMQYVNLKLYIDGNICYNKIQRYKDMLFQFNNSVYLFSYHTKTYIIKYILIAGIAQKKSMFNKLNNYSHSLLNEYLCPESPALIARINNWDNLNNSNYYLNIYYLNNTNNLVNLKLK
jgi:hypothetical protein